MMARLLSTPLGRQQQVLYLPVRGHTVVFGTADSGKTTLAIHRSICLADSSTDHYECTLLVTFNRCLVTYMAHLAGAIKGSVVVENYHRFARGYLSFRNKLPDRSSCNSDERLYSIRRGIRKARTAGTESPILKRHPKFFDDEFQWTQEHGVTNKEEYVETGRGGRVVGTDRPTLFDLYTRYLRPREKGGKKYNWSDLEIVRTIPMSHGNASATLRILRSGV